MLNEKYRLTNIREDKDIKSLSKAQFPGPHCPLFGAVMTASYIEDLTLLIIGTEECTYYGKDFAMIRQNGKDRVYSAVLEQHDITFGCEEDLKDIIIKIDREEKPKALMVITTCVVELIGEDTTSILRSLKDEVDTKLLIVKTEHFKCNSHIEGVEKALEQLASLMTPMEKKEKTVNILGFKYLGVENTELYKELKKNGVNISMTIPTKVNMETIQKAAESSLNIVVEHTALSLAKEMEKSLGIPYVIFPKALDLDKIVEAYEQIGDILDIKFDSLINEKYKSVTSDLIAAEQLLKNKSFIYGNTPFSCFEFSDFLVGLGMVPIVIQCRELVKSDREVMDRLIDKGVNPYIVRMANIAPLRRIYGELSPDYYFGHESPMILAEHNIVQIVTDNCAKKIGFEKITEVLGTILEEKGIFSLLDEKKSTMEDEVRDKIKNLKNMPAPMKKVLLNMKEIPDGMKEALLTLDDNDSMVEMMKNHRASM
ncbi:nitrogenase component 1 [Vallitalea guaymasensis]|uniref:Oxalate:formate antiporter n=1 Tax=Vallitalea guaymasensis TaxID=1185412 RepID=A0A8J8M7R6_9FIRM|nr:nitrogenase component 1 [Vallitalea guaymasensis]QUH27934.1 oxalate:formate antiporter [Vallitalea guaymasensis]